MMTLRQPPWPMPCGKSSELLERAGGCTGSKHSVQVHFLLNQDGSVAGQPEVLNGSSDPLFATTAQSAISAIMECQSYADIFPLDKYDLWKENTFNFNPNMMSGT